MYKMHMVKTLYLSILYVYKKYEIYNKLQDLV